MFINNMYSTIGYSIKTLIHVFVALQKGVNRMNYNQYGISLLMWDFKLFVSTVCVAIDCIEHLVDGAVIKEVDGNRKAGIKPLPLNIWSILINYIGSITALIMVSTLLIAHSLFVAVQRGDYIIPAFYYL
eukprot:499660_1